MTQVGIFVGDSLHTTPAGVGQSIRIESASDQTGLLYPTSLHYGRFHQRMSTIMLLKGMSLPIRSITPIFIVKIDWLQ